MKMAQKVKTRNVDNARKVDYELWDLRKEIIAPGEIEDLKELVDRVLKVYGDRISVVEIDEKNKENTLEYSAKRLVNDIYALGTALNHMGLNGKHIAIVGEGSYNWIISFLAVVGGVGVAVPLDKELTDFELSQLISKADCEAIICSKTYYKAAKMHMEKDDRVKHCFMMNGKERDAEGFYMLKDIIETGKKLIADGDRSYVENKITDRDQMAAILFTSGTTGANKGVMLSHYNFASNVEGIIATIAQENSSFSVLPMNHAYELSCNILTSLYMNAVLYINDSLRNILPNIQRFKPDAFASVPLILEGIYTGIWKAAEESGKAGILRKLIKFSNFLLKHGIDKRHELFGTVRKKFGDNFPTLVSGGAPARLEHVTGLYELGFTVYQGYGLTESSPTVTLNLQAGTNPESSGIVFPKAKFIIHDPDADGIGEVWLKGDNVTKGYYKDEEATAASFEDGWFKTGDYGRTNEKNELFIVGRKKNLIILDNGKNVFPEDIESNVMEGIKYIREVVAFEAVKNVRGKDVKIIAVAIYVDETDLPGKTRAEIEKMVNDDVTKVNRLMSSYKKIQDVMVVYEEFPKTSTRKVRRADVVAAYNEKNAVTV
ncbi:MAG: hypothetical protein E7558_00435 [Ruminococcaceae bacterium]|nr:hypothetical protein [Oscillospiraceae bacterium]